jgi:predicted nucleic acid-binding protein
MAIIILDNTVLSNFALVGQIDLLPMAFGSALATVPQVLAEFDEGVSFGRVPTTDWHWLRLLQLSPDEKVLEQQLRRSLGEGESACLAVAVKRSAQVLTDDRRARRVAGELGVAVSGTLGVLIRLVRAGQMDLPKADSIMLDMVHHGYRSPVITLKDLI